MSVPVISVTIHENHLTEAVPQPVSTINEDIELLDNPCSPNNEHTCNQFIDCACTSSTLSNLLSMDVCNHHQTVLDGNVSSESEYDHLTDYSSDTSELNISDCIDTENCSDGDSPSASGSLNRNADKDKHLSILSFLLKVQPEWTGIKNVMEMMSMLSNDNNSLKGLSF